MLPVSRVNSLVPFAVGTRLGSMLENFFNDDWLQTNGQKKSGWTAFPISMWDDEQHLHIQLDAPGMSDQDIELSVHQGVLTVRGERKFERKAGGYDTRTYGIFAQSVQLPATVDTDKVEAKLSNGVLHIQLPKSEVAKPRKISVKAE